MGSTILLTPFTLPPARHIVGCSAELLRSCGQVQAVPFTSKAPRGVGEQNTNLPTLLTVPSHPPYTYWGSTALPSSYDQAGATQSFPYCSKDLWGGRGEGILIPYQSWHLGQVPPHPTLVMLLPELSKRNPWC